MVRNADQSSGGAEGKGGASWVDLVKRQVDSLEYGVVQIVVHGSRVVQIDRTEKLRLTNPIADYSERV